MAEDTQRDLPELVEGMLPHIADRIRKAYWLGILHAANALEKEREENAKVASPPTTH